MLLQVSGITKLYGVTPVLSDIHMQIQERERVGLVGVNGAGKSTLLQIIAGELTPDAGTIAKPKDIKLGYLAQKGGVDGNRGIYDELQSVFSHLHEMERELRQLEQLMAEPDVIADELRFQQVLNRYDRLSVTFREQGGYEKDANIRSILHGMGFAEFAPDTPVGSLSGGQKTRLALAKLLLQAPDLLMLDEPTNYLDIATLTWLEAYLRAYPGAVLVVSHDRYFLDAITTTIYEIERTRAKRYSGNYSRFLELKEEEYEVSLKHFEKQQEEIRKLEDFVQRNIARASTTKRAQSRRKALERMERLDRPQGELKRASFRFEAERRTGKDVLETERLSTGYDAASPLLRNLDLRIERGESVALVGPNGIGKSTLLKTLNGDIPPLAGSFRWGANVEIAYYDQEHTSLTPGNTVLEELWSAYPHMEEVRIRTVLGSFLFSGEDVDKRISALSGGEKARVLLAKLMLLKANVLILDEPTNHLDLYSKEVLEEALLEYDGTILFISHDRYFINKLADRIVEMTADGVQHFLGNYDDYVEKKQELLEINDGQRGTSVLTAASKPTAFDARGDKPNETSEQRATTYEQEKQAKREERNRQRKIEQLEAAIHDKEEQLNDLEAELANPEVFNDYVKVQEINERLNALRSELEQAYAEWEGLLS